MSSLAEKKSHVFCPFLDLVSGFFTMSCLYILDTNPMSIIPFSFGSLNPKTLLIFSFFTHKKLTSSSSKNSKSVFLTPHTVFRDYFLTFLRMSYQACLFQYLIADCTDSCPKQHATRKAQHHMYYRCIKRRQHWYHHKKKHPHHK